MGRGLSPFQRAILRLARTNAEAEGRAVGEPARATSTTVRSCTPSMAGPRFARGDRQRTGAELRHAGSGHAFQPATDRARYKAHTVALVKALARLEERGLVVRVCGARARWSGANLTAEGRAAAEPPDPAELEVRRAAWRAAEERLGRAAATVAALGGRVSMAGWSRRTHDEGRHRHRGRLALVRLRGMADRRLPVPPGNDRPLRRRHGPTDAPRRRLQRGPGRRGAPRRAAGPRAGRPGAGGVPGRDGGPRPHPGERQRT